MEILDADGQPMTITDETDNNIFKDTPEFAEYKRLVNKNNMKQQRFAMEGVGLDNMSILQHRVELFIEFALPQDEFRRLEFELAWQKKIAESLELVDGEIARQKLLAGGRLHGVPRRG